MALLMKAGAIVRTILFGFVMYGVAAQVPQQSPSSPERGGAVRQSWPLLAQLAGPQPAEQSSGSLQTQPEVELRRFSLSSGASIEVSPEWIEREQMPLPPSPRLARFAPQVTFLEFAALENPKMHSVLRIATTTNPFLGGDEVALDVQMHSAAGSGSGLADYLFYFFFSPPRDCLDGGSEEGKEPGRIAGPDGFAGPEYSHVLQTRTHAGGFLFERVESGCRLSIHKWSGARERHLSGVLSDADGKSGGERADILRV